MINKKLIEISKSVSGHDKVKFGILIALLGLLFYRPMLNLIQIWSNDADYSHGFFVIPISLFMVWNKRKYLLASSAKPSFVGFPMLIIAISVYLIAVITNFHTLTYFSIILILLSLCYTLFGFKYSKHLVLPILFLVFMFPIPNAYYILITNPLKLVITDISTLIIRLFGIPVFKDGNLLYFANTSLEVAEACSGLRSIYSYLMLGIVFSLMCIKIPQKVIIVLSTIPLSLFVNIVRVSFTGILSHYYGSEVAQGFFHEFTGLLLFIIGFIVLYLEYYIITTFFYKDKKNHDIVIHENKTMKL